MSPRKGDVPRIAVIGTGWYGTLANVPGLAEYAGAELVAVCDTDEARARAAAKQFNVENWFNDLAALLSSGLVDGAVVTVPHTAHYQVCRAVLDAGVHAMVEKPMTLRGTEAWDLVRRAEAANLHLMVGHTYQFTSTAAWVKENLSRIGGLVQVVGNFASHTERLFRGEAATADGRGAFYGDPALAGGGQGYAQLSHLAGMAFWAADLEAEEVCGFVENRGLAVDLVDALAVRFSGDAIGTFSSTGTMPAEHPPRESIAYYGTTGAVFQDLATARVELLLPGHPAGVIELAPGEPRYPISAPARVFADMIAGRVSESPGDAVAAARSVEFLEAAYRSARSGHRVRIDELDAQEA